MKFENIEELVGNTPLVRFNTSEIPEGASIYVKLEGFNPTGSIKDRACLWNIYSALEKGTLKEGMTILDASSGNMACAISFFGKILEFKTKLVCGSKLTEDKKNFIEYYGAELIMHGDFTIQGNKYCRELASADPEKYCFLDQLHNENNPLAAYESLGPEIYEDLSGVKMVVGSLGSGGSMCGCSKFLKEKNKEIICVTVEASSGSKIPGTGTFVDGDYITPFIEQGRKEFFDHSVSIDLPSAQKRTVELAKQGIFVGWQSGGVLEAAIQMINKLGVIGDVVIISGDSGWKNINKLMGK